MKFKHIRYVSDIQGNQTKNTFYLENRNWDDFGYKTTYWLYFVDNQKKLITIGEVKILNKTLKLCILPKEFEYLNKDFYSLGQDRNYYTQLKNLGYDIYSNLFKNLRDIAINKSLIEEINEEEGYHFSLLRESLAVRMLTVASEIINNKIESNKNIFYTYNTLLKNATSPHIVDFDFKQQNKIPHRLFALIGKNGVGKTNVLENLLYDLICKNKVAFKNQIVPEYNNLLLFTYGIYDKFLKIENEADIAIFGLKLENSNEDNFLEEIKNRLDVIEAKERTLYLEKLMHELLNNKCLEKAKRKESFQDELSSGERIIFEFVINLISEIEENTLIIIDEIENHLHPNIIGKLINYLTRILEDYNSYSIISTHSPIILQQIPSKSVRIIERHQNDPYIRKIDIECFGENLSEITNNVFQVSEVEDNYKIILKKLSKEKTYDEILNIFNKKLSLNARFFLNFITSENKSDLL